jgi:hypothetical protein
VGSKRKWQRADVVAFVALVVAGASLLLDFHTRYLWKEPAVHNLSASAFNFEFPDSQSSASLKVDIALQNKGNRAELIRQINFVLPCPAAVFTEGRGRAVPAHAVVALDFVTGIGTVWPDSTRIALANIELQPGDIELRQLRQPITQEAILRFLRENKEMLPGDQQPVALEFVSVGPQGHPISQIVVIGAVDRQGNWSTAEWVPADLLAATHEYRFTPESFIRVETSEGAVK